MRSLLISVLFLSITLICIFSVNKIEFGYQLEDYFTAGSSDFETYQNHKSTFGEDNNFLMIGFESRENAFQLEFLNPIKKIGENIEKIDGVKQVINPTTLKRMIRLPFLGFKSENILSLDTQEDLDKSQKRIHSNKTIFHSLFSRDSSSILMYLILEDTVKKNDGEKILTNIKKTIDSAPLIDGTMVYYAGQINTQAYYRNALQNEVVFFGILTIILLLGFLYLAYRSVYLAVYALVCLSIAFIISGSITIAFLGELDFLMTLLPSIIFTIGISTIIHLIDDYKVYGLQPAIGQNLELNRALKKPKKLLSFAH